MPDQPDNKFASRGGLKLAAALEKFDLSVQDKVCADLGCSTGGFVDCMIQAGSRKVFAVDTAYGELAWKLRQDERVVVLERTNALHFDPHDEQGFEPCDLVTIDLGWTKQDRAIPTAMRWLSEDADARIITLIKPHYESGQHRLTDEQADAVTAEVVEHVLPTLGVRVLDWMRSPIRGGKGKNLEHLALLERAVGNEAGSNL